MASESRHYSIEELLALRESPLVTKPDLPPQMEQWITQPAIERKNLQNSQSHANTENESKYRSTESRRSRGDSIVLGPPQMSFASSLHSPPLRKSGNKDSVVPSSRNRPSPPNDDVAVSTTPQEEEEEGWSKVRSAARGNSSRGFEKRGGRGERRGGRESFDGPPAKGTGFRNHREGESQNWRNERAEPHSTEQTRNGRCEERAEFLEEEEGFGGGGGGSAGSKEHSAEEFQAWITKMRGGNPKSEDVNDTPNESSDQNVSSIEQPKIDKSKIVDVDSLFALDAPSLDETSSKRPSSSVFFDSAPTAGRASRFRTLFAQDTIPQLQQLPPEPGNRPIVDRRQSVPTYSSAPKPAASVEDREGFQRIMAMLGGGASKPNMPNFIDKSPPMQPLPPPPMQDVQGQGESKDDFFKRLLRQGQPMGGNGPAPFTNPPMMPMNRNNGPMDQQQPRISPADMEANMQNMHQRMNRPQPPQQSRSQHADPRFPPFDLHSPPPPLPPPPQGAPWMHPPPGFSPPNSRFPFPGPPLSPGGLPPPPPPGGYGPPPPGMIPYGGPPPPPPGFGRGGVFSPLPPPPGQDGWHPPPGFGGGFYQDGDGRER